jgi:polar amino acid transport system substrate-binding protein
MTDDRDDYVPYDIEDSDDTIEAVPDDASDDVEVYSLEDEEDLTSKKRQMDILFFSLLAGAALVLAAIVYLLIQQFSGGGTTPPPPTAGDGSWERVRERGTLIVGTSLDYPPFGFRNAQFQPDGFDIALIREMANRLGLSVEITDMAFDGLGGALSIGQIDAAIAAISVTPEREQFVDFSNIYFVSEDAILANDQSPLSSITTVQQMAGQRVGVQRGSVYETWLTRNLVDTGLTPSNLIFLYETADAAVRDLREGRLDLVVMDRQPADIAAAQGGLKIIGQSLNQQRLAIAVPNGADSLREQLNGALIQLQNEGRVAQLVQQFMNLPPEQIIPPPLPTATPVVPPTATPLPIVSPTPVPCVNGMQFVADLNLPDQNMTAPPPVPPGQPFSKGWRIRNTGTCTWDPSFRLIFVSGNVPGASMGGQPTPVQGQVAPGQTYDIFVNLVAPLQPGVYQGVWQMTAGNNVPFGDRIWVGVTVPAPATPTPAPTQTPSPSINFTVDSTNIQQGQCTTFRWTVTNSAAVFFYAQGQDWRTQPVPAVGTRQECPQSTTTYFLRVQNLNGTVEERQITVNVTAAPNAPTINQFVANPPQITFGQCVNLQWNVTGDITRIIISGNGRPLWEGAPSSATFQDCPAVIGTVGYTLQAQGPGGTSQAQEYVNVVDVSTATPAPTPPPANPVIDSFSVSPAQVAAGGCVQIAWSTSGATWVVRLLRNNVLVLDNAGLSGSAQDCLPNPGNITYQLVASTSGGQSTTAQQDVLVTAVTVPNPLAGKTYNLLNLNGQPVAPNTQVNTTFNFDGTVAGSGGCNSYSGRYVVENNAISITGLTNASAACVEPPGVMEQETAFWSALNLARTFEIPDPTTLIMRDGAGQEILRYGLPQQ